MYVYIVNVDDGMNWYVYVYLCMYVYVCVCMFICTYECMYVRMFVRMHVIYISIKLNFTYKCMYVCTYAAELGGDNGIRYDGMHPAAYVAYRYGHEYGRIQWHDADNYVQRPT